MWDNDCGSVPVVDEAGSAIAMITDRDICMAAYTQGRALGEISVASAMSSGLVAVHETDELEVAEALMREHQVRRLPVIDAKRRPVGVVSLSDLARQSQTARGVANGADPKLVTGTLAAICAPPSRDSAPGGQP